MVYGEFVGGHPDDAVVALGGKNDAIAMFEHVGDSLDIGVLVVEGVVSEEDDEWHHGLWGGCPATDGTKGGTRCCLV